MSGRRTRREGGGNLEIANPAIPRFPPPRLLLFFLRSDKNQTQAKVLPMSPVYCVTYVPVHSRSWDGEKVTLAGGGITRFNVAPIAPTPQRNPETKSPPHPRPESAFPHWRAKPRRRTPWRCDGRQTNRSPPRAASVPQGSSARLPAPPLAHPSPSSWSQPRQYGPTLSPAIRGRRVSQRR